MIQSFIFIAIIATSCFLSGSLQARGQSQLQGPPASAATLEKRIAELEGRIAPLQKELQDLRRQLHEQSPMTLVPLAHIDAFQAAELLGGMYLDTPGVVVVALPFLNCVAVRADRRTTRELMTALRHLDKAAQAMITRHRFDGGARGLSRVSPRIHLDDETALVALLEFFAKRQPPDKK
jgi:hypothetical protein